MCDARDEPREDERRNDHLDQAQEDITDQGAVSGDLLRGLRVRPRDIAQLPNSDLEQYFIEDGGGEPELHRFPPNRRA
ncbi:hypothetical protein [Methylobacterium sp. Leaf89]|uniref:hypothetical protein n=1 Tax=Methylobacterium sp. Leaf89 TaxID=1736245 RepID=UPI000A9BCC57|nr:hypothetical protein [Methylobacterium sp. Leaf89]